MLNTISSDMEILNTINSDIENKISTEINYNNYYKKNSSFFKEDIHRKYNKRYNERKNNKEYEEKDKINEEINEKINEEINEEIYGEIYGETSEETSEEKKEETSEEEKKDEKKDEKKEKGKDYINNLIKNKGNIKVSFKTVENIIKENYGYKEISGSIALDIIAIYLRGQKLLYTEGKTYCEKQLNSLMLPAIFISATCTVLSLALQNHHKGPLIIASLNAINSFILTLISYLKLDAKAEAHKTSAYKYEKLQSMVEFNSGKIFFNSYFVENDFTLVCDILEKIEADVSEIKETNQFILPEYIRHCYPNIYSTNVFSKIKKIQNEEIILINELKNIINEKITNNDYTNNDLNTSQNNLIKQIINQRYKYQDLDSVFEIEIRKQIHYKKINCFSFNWFIKYGIC